MPKDTTDRQDEMNERRPPAQQSKPVFSRIALVLTIALWAIAVFKLLERVLT